MTSTTATFFFEGYRPNELQICTTIINDRPTLRVERDPRYDIAFALFPMTFLKQFSRLFKYVETHPKDYPSDSSKVAAFKSRFPSRYPDDDLLTDMDGLIDYTMYQAHLSHLMNTRTETTIVLTCPLSHFVDEIKPLNHGLLMRRSFGERFEEAYIEPLSETLEIDPYAESYFLDPNYYDHEANTLHRKQIEKNIKATRPKPKQIPSAPHWELGEPFQRVKLPPEREVDLDLLTAPLCVKKHDKIPRNRNMKKKKIQKHFAMTTKLSARQNADQCHSKQLCSVVLPSLFIGKSAGIVVDNSVWTWDKSFCYMGRDEFTDVAIESMKRYGLDVFKFRTVGSDHTLKYAHMLACLCFGQRVTFFWKEKSTGERRIYIQSLWNRAHPKMFKAFNIPFFQDFYAYQKTHVFFDFEREVFSPLTLKGRTNMIECTHRDLGLKHMVPQVLLFFGLGVGATAISMFFGKPFYRWCRQKVRDAASYGTSLAASSAVSAIKDGFMNAFAAARDKLCATYNWCLDRLSDMASYLIAFGTGVMTALTNLGNAGLGYVKMISKLFGLTQPDDPEEPEIDIHVDTSEGYSMGPTATKQFFENVKDPFFFESMEPQSYGGTVAVLATFASQLAVLAKGGSFSDPAKIVYDHFAGISRIGRGTDTALEFGKTMTGAIWHYLTGSFLYSSDQLADDVQRLCKEVSDCELKIAAAGFNGILPTEVVERMSSFGPELKQLSIKLTAMKATGQRNVADSLLILVTDSLDKCIQLQSQSHGKIQPVGIILHGAPKRGKTQLAKHLPSYIWTRFDELCTEAKLPNPYAAVNPVRSIKFWECTKVEKFFEGYQNQWAVVCDELYSSADNEVNAFWSSHFMQFMNDKAVPMEMAFGDKGKMFFTSPLLIATTNEPSHVITHKEPKAYHRRIDFDLHFDSDITATSDPFRNGFMNLTVDAMAIHGDPHLRPHNEFTKSGMTVDKVFSVYKLVDMAAQVLFARVHGANKIQRPSFDELRVLPEVFVRPHVKVNTIPTTTLPDMVPRYGRKLPFVPPAPHQPKMPFSMEDVLVDMNGKQIDKEYYRWQQVDCDTMPPPPPPVDYVLPVGFTPLSIHHSPPPLLQGDPTVSLNDMIPQGLIITLPSTADSPFAYCPINTMEDYMVDHEHFNYALLPFDALEPENADATLQLFTPYNGPINVEPENDFSGRGLPERFYREINNVYNLQQMARFHPEVPLEIPVFLPEQESDTDSDTSMSFGKVMEKIRDTKFMDKLKKAGATVTDVIDDMNRPVSQGATPTTAAAVSWLDRIKGQFRLTENLEGRIDSYFSKEGKMIWHVNSNTLYDKTKFFYRKWFTNYDPELGLIADPAVKYFAQRELKRYAWIPSWVPYFGGVQKYYTWMEDVSVMRDTRTRLPGFQYSFQPDTVRLTNLELKRIAEISKPVALLLESNLVMQTALATEFRNTTIGVDAWTMVLHKFCFGELDGSQNFDDLLDKHSQFGVVNGLIAFFGIVLKKTSVTYNEEAFAHYYFERLHRLRTNGSDWNMPLFNAICDQAFLLTRTWICEKKMVLDFDGYVVKLHKDFIESSISSFLSEFVTHPTEMTQNVRDHYYRKNALRNVVSGVVLAAAAALIASLVTYAFASAPTKPEPLDLQNAFGSSQEKNDSYHRSRKKQPQPTKGVAQRFARMEIKTYKKGRKHDHTKRSPGLVFDEMHHQGINIPPIEGVEPQGFVTCGVRSKVANATYNILAYMEGTFQTVGHLIYVRNQVLIMNKHVYANLPDEYYIFSPKHMDTRAYAKRDLQFLWQPPGRDIVYLKNPNSIFHPNIMKFAPKRDDVLHYVSNNSAVMLREETVHRSGEEEPDAVYDWEIMSPISMCTQPRDFGKGTVASVECVEYYIGHDKNNGPGLCGLPVAALVHSDWCFMGAHQAGSTKMGTVAIAPVYAEDEEHYKEFLNAIDKPVYQMSFGNDDPNGFFCEKMGNVFECQLKTKATGVTRFIPTPLNDPEFALQPTKAPAILTKQALDIAHVKREAAASACARLHPWVIEQVNTQGVDLLGHYTQMETPGELKRCQTLPVEQALWGDGDSVKPFDFTTSDTMRLKRAHVKKREVADPSSNASAYVMTLVAMMLSLIAKGNFCYMIAYDYLKDELRDLERVSLMKTRIFYIVDFIDNVLTKMALGQLVTRLKRLFPATDSSCGVAPGRRFWSLIFEKFVVSPFGVVGADIATNDSIHHPFLMMLIASWCCAFYPKANVAGLTRNLIFWALIASAQCLRFDFGKGFYMRTGNPSGGWLTTFINTVYNSLVHRLCFTWCCMKRGLPCGADEYKFFVREFYSDDNLSASLKYDWWTLEMFADTAKLLFGITLTDPDKGFEFGPNKAITYCSYLSRGFVRHPRNPHIILAPLSEDSLLNQLFFVRKPKKGAFDQTFVFTQLQQNINNVILELREYSNTDRATFIRDAIATFVANRNLPLVVPPYDARVCYEDVFLDNLY